MYRAFIKAVILQKFLSQTKFPRNEKNQHPFMALQLKNKTLKSMQKDCSLLQSKDTSHAKVV